MNLHDYGRYYHIEYHENNKIEFSHMYVHFSKAATPQELKKLIPRTSSPYIFIEELLHGKFIATIHILND